MANYKVKLLMSEEYIIAANSEEEAVKEAKARFGCDYYIDNVLVTQCDSQKGNQMKRYITYEEPLAGRVFTEDQMVEVYRDMADKKEYMSYNIWLEDMLRSGVFEEVRHFITIAEVKEKARNGCETFMRKDNSVRGCSCVLANAIKVGDEIVIDDYFTLVVE